MSATAYVGARLIDGTDREPIDGASVVVDKGRVAYSGPTARAPRRTGEVAIDVSGLVIMPGLVDCHLHLSGIRVPDSLAWTLEPNEQKAMLSVGQAYRLVTAGVTTACDVSRNGAHLRALIDAGEIPGPRVVPCGPGISRTGGFNVDSNGLPPDLVQASHPYGVVADGPDAVRRTVRELIRYGARCIKVWATGPVTLRSPADSGQELTAAELATVVEEAHCVGIPVQAHAESLAGSRAALEAGVDINVHGEAMDDACLDLMQRGGRTLLPTLNIGAVDADPYDYGGMLPPPDLQGYPGDSPEEQMEQRIRAVFRGARSAGVRIAVGSDTFCEHVMPYGDSSLREVAALVDYGMSEMEALSAATRAGAQALGLIHETGTLEPGKSADLLVLRQDPLQDIKALKRENILMVLKGGEVVLRSPELH
jgi:imidazolonepropionase-like amidohydrolase